MPTHEREPAALDAARLAALGPRLVVGAAADPDAAAAAAEADDAVVGVGSRAHLLAAAARARAERRALVLAPDLAVLDVALALDATAIVLDPEGIAATKRPAARAALGTLAAVPVAVHDWSSGVATDTTYPWHRGAVALALDTWSALVDDADRLARGDVAAWVATAERWRTLVAAGVAIGHRRMLVGAAQQWVAAVERELGPDPTPGVLVALGTMLVARIQRQPVEPIDALIRRLGLPVASHAARVDAIAVPALRAVPRLARGTTLDVTILDHRRLDVDPATVVWRATVAAALGG